MTEDRRNHLLSVREFFIEREVDGFGRKAYAALLWNTTLEVLADDGSEQPVKTRTPKNTILHMAPRWSLERAWKWITHRMAEKAKRDAQCTQNSSAFRDFQHRLIVRCMSSSGKLEPSDSCTPALSSACDQMHEPNNTICLNLEGFDLCESASPRTQETS